MQNYFGETTNNQHMTLGELCEKAAAWFIIGKTAGLSGAGLGFCTLLGPILDKSMGLNLDKTVAQVLEQARQEKIVQEKAARTQALLKSIGLKNRFEAAEPLASLFGHQESQDSETPHNTKINTPRIDEERKWREVIIHPSVVLILGKRGSGKSALGYYLLELFHYAFNIYVVGVPQKAQSLLPDWIGVVPSLEILPPKCIALVDEAYLRYHARSSNTDESIFMSKLLNLSRQKEQSIIFVSQEARQLDRNIVSSADVIVFKDLGILQIEFDRRELNRIAKQAKQALDSVIGDKRSWNYTYSPSTDFIGPIKNSLPTFWCNKLSRIFASTGHGGESTIKPARQMTLSKKICTAKELNGNNHSIGQIAKILGVSKGTVYNYLHDYPYVR